MKKALMIATAALTVLGATAGAASAQSYGYNGYGGYHARYDRQEARQDRREYRQDRREYRQQRRWARGQYMPSQYRTRAYVVNDYRRYHLAPPPRGYHYVRQDNDVVLTAIATGLIASVIFGALSN